jgi:hypothetical protein
VVSENGLDLCDDRSDDSTLEDSMEINPTLLEDLALDVLRLSLDCGNGGGGINLRSCSGSAIPSQFINDAVVE